MNLRALYISLRFLDRKIIEVKIFKNKLLNKVKFMPTDLAGYLHYHNIDNNNQQRVSQFGFFAPNKNKQDTKQNQQNINDDRYTIKTKLIK